MEFTQEELTYLQSLMDSERRGWFNYHMQTLNDDTMTGNPMAYERYQLANALRGKFYRLGGRDPLALAPGYHEQRVDQPHNN